MNDVLVGRGVQVANGFDKPACFCSTLRSQVTRHQQKHLTPVGIMGILYQVEFAILPTAS